MDSDDSGMDTHVYKGGEATTTGKTLAGLPYRLIYAAYRRLPSWCHALVGKSRVLRRLKVSVRNFLARHASRGDIYNRSYYAYVDAEATRSAGVIIGFIVEDARPQTLVDVGCGTGALLCEARRHGITARGYEYSPAALAVCRSRGLDVRSFDLEADSALALDDRPDVAVCLEVAEHIPPEAGDRLVVLLANLSNVVFFSAAVPGQGGGVDHINEQPHEYWIERFSRQGLQIDHRRTAAMRGALLAGGAAGFYTANVMVFSQP
jgi:SAM-dependent methyltransferase